jgi:hypothetical protein
MQLTSSLKPEKNLNFAKNQRKFNIYDFFMIYELYAEDIYRQQPTNFFTNHLGWV